MNDQDKTKDRLIAELAELRERVAKDEWQRAERTLQRANEELEQRVKEQTAELQRSNEELSIFRRFAEASAQGFGMADMDGYITYLNPVACRLAGVARPEDAIGQHLASYYPEGYSLRRETEIVPALLQEGHWEGEVTVPTGGKTMTVLQHSFLIRDDKGNPSRLASVITDITERKEVELALRTNEERFRSYFEQALIGMAVSTPERQWFEVNDRLCDILGYSRAELVGMKWTDATHPDDVGPGLVTFERIATGEIDHFTQEKRFIRKDGSIVYTNIFVRSFRRKDGTVDHFLALIEDITERKQAQEALERERRTLFHMLRASDHERQLISYDIHDGLAQQLASAIMQLQAYNGLKKHDSGKAKTAYDAGVQMLQQAHAEARRLISGVRPPILDESGITAALAHLVHDHTKPGGPKVEFHSGVKIGRLAKVLENAIYRIAQEALANALQHSGSERVKVSLIQNNNDLRLEVQDWGVGFDPQSVDENRFGLEGIRERSRFLGGECSIESEPGKGACVRVVLPILEEEQGGAAITIAPCSDPGM